MITDPKYRTAITKVEAGDIVGATNELLELLDKDPNHIPSLITVGKLLQDQGKPDEAIRHLQLVTAIREGSSRPEAWLNLGNVLADLGDANGSLNAFDAGLKVAPKNSKVEMSIRHCRAMTILQGGNFREGWKELEWRFGPLGSDDLKHLFPQYPIWHGEDLSNKTLLVHSEQGFGDSIQFARYLSLISASASRVILRCNDPLVRLFQSIKGINVIPAHQLPAADFQVSMMSLPFWLQCAEIPNRVPYVAAPPDSIQRWKDRLKADIRVRIGVAWTGEKGNTRNLIRSLSEADARRLMTLFDIPDLSIYSLQRGESDAFERIAVLGSARRFDLTGEISDVSDTAALIANLDAIVSVDTMSAHLAGALEAEVFTALASNCDWRWMRNRDDSPWYPSMRLIRQKTLRDWDPVIEQIGAEIRRICASQGRRTRRI